MNSEIPTSSSTTTTGTTYHPDMIQYWKDNPTPPPPIYNYIENVGQLIEFLQKFPLDTKVLGYLNEKIIPNFIGIREANEWDAHHLVNGQTGDKYIIL